MRLFQGMRRPMGGFMMDPDEPNRRQQQERNDRKAEADRLRYIRLVQQTNRRMEMMMKTLDEVLQLVYDQRGQIDSLSTLLSLTKHRLEEVIRAGGLTKDQQSKIDQIFDEMGKNASAITKAINANDDDPSNDEKPAESPPVEPALTPTSVSVASSKNPSTAGEEVTFTASVSMASGSGSTTPITGGVSFYADDTAIGTAALDSTGVAAMTGKPPEGEHDITASYSGDTNYAASDSAEFTQVVKSAAATGVDAGAGSAGVDAGAGTSQG